MTISKGDTIHTPRFLDVKIHKVFDSIFEMYAEGYTEPTHYINDTYVICGKSLGNNRMIFAAALKR